MSAVYHATVYSLPSGSHIVDGIPLTLDWEADRTLTRQLVHVNAAQYPSIIICRPGTWGLERHERKTFEEWDRAGRVPCACRRGWVAHYNSTLDNDPHGNHLWVGLCCVCHVELGRSPADWHPLCLETAKVVGHIQSVDGRIDVQVPEHL